MLTVTFGNPLAVADATLNMVSLAFTVGGIVALLLMVGAVVAALRAGDEGASPTRTHVRRARGPLNERRWRAVCKRVREMIPNVFAERHLIALWVAVRDALSAAGVDIEIRREGAAADLAGAASGSAPKAFS